MLTGPGLIVLSKIRFPRRSSATDHVAPARGRLGDGVAKVVAHRSEHLSGGHPDHPTAAAFVMLRREGCGEQQGCARIHSPMAVQSLRREIAQANCVTAVGVVADQDVKVAEHAAHCGDESLSGRRVAKVPRNVHEPRLSPQTCAEFCEEFTEVIGPSVLVHVVRHVVMHRQ